MPVLVKPNHLKICKDLSKLGFFTAIKFLTIFPVPGRWDKAGENFGMALPFFPLVGLLLGGILFGLNYGLAFILPLPVVYILLIIALVIMTGAHHIDGLIDTFDGIVIGKTRERRLEIMADSRVGAFGITAAILIILLKYISLLSVPVALPALLLMPVLSRWLVVTIIFTFPGYHDLYLSLCQELRHGTGLQTGSKVVRSCSCHSYSLNCSRGPDKLAGSHTDGCPVAHQLRYCQLLPLSPRRAYR
jgi:chromate transport protein ChrA